MGGSGNLWIVVKVAKPLVVYEVECEMAMDSMKGKRASFELIWGTPIYFAFLRCHQYSSLVVTVFLGFSSVPSGKSRFLTSLNGNMELLSMK